MVRRSGSPQRGSSTEDTGSSTWKNNTIPTWMKSVNRTPTKDHVSYKQFIREEKPIMTAKYPFLMSSQIERKLRLEWQTTMRSEKGRGKSNRSSAHTILSAAKWEYLAGEVDTTVSEHQERVFSPKLGPRLGTKTYGGGVSWIHQSLTPPKIVQKGRTKAMNGILSRSTEKPRGSAGKVSFQKMMPSRERSKSESSMSDKRHQPRGSYTSKCNMGKVAQEKEKFDGDIYSLSDSDSDKEHQLTTLHKSTKGRAAKLGSTTKSARRMSHAHTRVRKSKDHQKTKCAVLFEQENTVTTKEDDMCKSLGAELSDSDDERDRQLLGLEGNVLITEGKESESKQKKTCKSASTRSRQTATGSQRTITSMFNVMETFSNKGKADGNSNEKCPKALSDADPKDSEELVQSESDVDMDEDDNDDGPGNHFPESETTQLFSKISKLKQSVSGTIAQATPQNTEGTNKLIKMIQTPSTDSKTISDLTTPANPESLVQQVIKKASKVPHKKRPNEQVSQSEKTLEDTKVASPVISPKQKRARRSLNVTNTSTSLNTTCHKRNTRSLTQPLELESPLAEPFCPNKGRKKKSSIAVFKESDMSVSDDSDQESHSEVEMKFESTPAQKTKNKAPPNNKTSMSSPKFLKGQLKGKTPENSVEIDEEDAMMIIETELQHLSSTVTSPIRTHAEPAPNVRRTPVRTPVMSLSTDLHGGFSVTPSPSCNVRRAPPTPIFRRSPRLTTEDLLVTESAGPIPVFKTPKGIPSKAKSRKSLSPKPVSKVNEEACLKPSGLKKDRSTHQDTSLSRGLNTDMHLDNAVTCDVANEEGIVLDASLPGDLNIGKSVHSDSLVPSDLNMDKTTNADSTVSSICSMNVSSFYKSRLKQKKGNILPDVSHQGELPVQSVVRPTSPENKRPSKRTSQAKGPKVKVPNNTLDYFGFGDDLDDHNMDESNNKESSDAIEYYQDEYETDTKSTKENVKPVKPKSGRRKAKDALEMDSPNATETHRNDYEINNRSTKENVKPAETKSDRHKTKDRIETESLDTAETDYNIDTKHIKENKENRVPTKTKRARETVKDIAEIVNPDATETHQNDYDVDNKHIREKRASGKAKRDTEVSSPSSTLSAQSVVRPTSPKNRKPLSKAKGSKVKCPSNTLDYFGFGDDLDDHDMDESNHKVNPDPIECYHDENETNNKCIKENVKPVKPKSGRRKTKDALEMESPNATETHQNDYEINDRSTKENVKPAETKSGRHKTKDGIETESLDTAETDYNIDTKHIKGSRVPTKTKRARVTVKDIAERVNPDATETHQHDYDVDNKHIREKRASGKAKRDTEVSSPFSTPSAQSVVRPTSPKDRKPYSKAKGSKVKGPSNTLDYFGFGDDLDDHDMDESKHNENSDPIECYQDEYETDNKSIKENVKSVKPKSGRRKTKDTLEMEIPNAPETHQNDCEINDGSTKENVKPAETKSGRHKTKEGIETKSLDTAETDHNIDTKHIKENREPTKTKRARETVKQSVVRSTSPKNRKPYSKAKGSKVKGPSNTLDYFGFGDDLDDHDMDGSNNKENSDPIECYHDENETDNECIKENVKPVKAKSGRRKAKNTLEMECLDSAEVDDELIKENKVPTKAKRATDTVEDTQEMESPNAAETHWNDYKVNDRRTKENVKPAKTKSGRHKTKDGPEMESLDVSENDQKDYAVDDKQSKVNRVSGRAKRHRQTVKDIAGIENPDTAETDHNDSIIDEKHIKDKVKPAKTESSRHRMKEDTAESHHSDYDINDKHIKNSVKPAKTKKAKHGKKDTPEMRSQDSAETHNDDYMIDEETQNILNLNPLDTLVEGFRKKSVLQFGEPFNWDSCLKEDSDELKLVDPDENDLLRGHRTTIAEDETSDDTPPPTQSQSAMTSVQDTLQKLRTIASPDILNMDEFVDYDLEEVLSSLKSSKQSSQVSDLSSLSLPSDQENKIPTKSATTAALKGADNTEHSTSTRKETIAFKKPTNTSSGNRKKETKKTCPKMTYDKVGQVGQGDGLSWASDLFDEIVTEREPSHKVDTGIKETPKSKHNAVQKKERKRPNTPDVDVCGLFEETPRTSARRLLTSSQHQTDSNFHDLFSAKDSSSFFM